MIPTDQFQHAWEMARADLLAARTGDGPWTGRLASSPVSTATAISALVLAEQHGGGLDQEYFLDAAYQGDLSELIVDGLHWLARHQNPDGGWGDTDKSHSNISATMLVEAAFHLTGVPVRYADLLERAAAYIRQEGGVAGLRRRYGRDRTFATPILTNCALADLVPWREVPALPFELACLPQEFYRRVRLGVVSYAIPALVAVGQARFLHRKPLNPITRLLRHLALGPSLKVLAQMQPESGGFLEATPLTSFVVMSLASTGRADHPVTRRGVEFLLGSVRADGSWPIDTNLATWNTSLAVSALARGPADEALKGRVAADAELVDWILSCQHREVDPATGAAPGGWAWTDLPGGLPDTDDTAGALLALSACRPHASDERRRRIDAAAADGAVWLLDLQNADGGWPTFCRGWGRLPFDRSGVDLTGHALRALAAWQQELAAVSSGDVPISERIGKAIAGGLENLKREQRSDGSWVPLWFGNQHLPGEENPIYGTARVVTALAELGQHRSPAAERGIEWLVSAQQPVGGWGGGPAAVEEGMPLQASSVEETALAIEALLASGPNAERQAAIDGGLAWLVEAVENGRHFEAAPIGCYFARLWYYEQTYPLVFTAAALGRAVAGSLTPAVAGEAMRHGG